MTMAAPSTNTTTATTTTSNGNGTGKATREAKPLTAIDAISKITKILDQLSTPDRKRVLAFVNESSEGAA
jgi:hypothetical protein